MRCTALPFRVTPEGKLEQQDGFDAVLELIRAMAGTTATNWPHAPWFGLLELFAEAANRDRQDQESLKDAINVALKNLGVVEWTVQSVVTGRVGGTGQRRFKLTIEDRAGQALFGDIDAR